MGCRLQRVYAENYYGLKNGINVNKFELVFSDNDLVYIHGLNGKGKSTLATQIMQPYPDANICFVPNVNAKKQLQYNINGDVYIFTLDHPVTSEIDPVTGYRKRGTAKGYITKINEDGSKSELNPTGSVTMYTEYVNTLFVLDSNFMSLLRISAEDGGLVRKTPTERKKYISYVIDAVQVYYELLKLFKKQELIFNNKLDELATKIKMIGTQEELAQAKLLNDTRYDQLTNEIDAYKAAIAKLQSKIEILDPTNTLQNMYIQLTSDIRSNDIQKETIKMDIVAYMEENKIPIVKSIEECKALYQERIDGIQKLKLDIESIMKENISKQAMVEDIDIDIQKQRAQIESMSLNFNYTDLVKTIKDLTLAIEGYESFFKSINISERDALNITKDEYVSALTTLKTVEEAFDSIISQYYQPIYTTAIECINTPNSNYVNDINAMQEEVDRCAKKLQQYDKDSAYYYGLLERGKILTNRPSNCHIDTCPFIKDAVDCMSKEPEKHLEIMSKEYGELNQRVEELSLDISRVTEIMNCSLAIKQAMKLHQTNKAIIKKLPLDKNITDINCMLQCIHDGLNPFASFDEIYKYIDRANIIEEYKLALKQLDDCNKELDLYKDKSSLFESIEESIHNFESKMQILQSEISGNLGKIETMRQTIDEYQESIPNIEYVITLYDKYSELTNENNMLGGKIKEIEQTINNINNALGEIEMYNTRLTEAQVQLAPVQRDKERISHNIRLVQEYIEEYNEVEADYKYVATIKKYLNPTQEGIQNVYIQVYINKAIDQANELLSTMFGGNVILKHANLQNGFTIPCVSGNTGLVRSDISLCSRSERTMINLTLGAVLQKQSASNYNILVIDEAEESLDTENRLNFTPLLNAIKHAFGIGQIFIITHTMELDTSTGDNIMLEDGEIYIKYHG